MHTRPLALVLSCLVSGIAAAAVAQVPAGVTVDNGAVRRTIVARGDSIVCTGLYLAGADASFTQATSTEFAFLADGEAFDSDSGWRITAVTTGTDSTTVSFRGSRPRTAGFAGRLTYVTAGALPVFEKTLELRNVGRDTVRLEAVDVEALDIAMGSTHAITYRDFARRPHFGPFVGDWNDAGVVVHDHERARGVFVGNHAPGVLKRTSAFTDGYRLRAGLTRPGQDYPFRKYLAPGETFRAPVVTIGLYAAPGGPEAFLREVLSEYTSRHLRARIHAIPRVPTLVTNTWRPFQDAIDGGLVLAQAEAAARLGFEQQTIDAGWYTTHGEGARDLSWADRTGDWIVDSVKFPRGLAPVMRGIDRAGLAPGLWISLTSAHPVSAVYRAHPEWFIVGPDGAHTNLHNPDNDIRTACFGTGWYDYILNVIDGYVGRYDLRYVKLDLSVVTSAYIHAPTQSGCYATDHPGHRDHAESYWTLYERLFALFDTLHAAHPDLFIDCTFETAGRLQLVDYAFAKHAEGDWLSNIEDPQPYAGLRARHLAWSRAAVIPASALAIGNLSLDGERYGLSVQSMLGSLPLLLGDFRPYPAAKRERIRAWTDQVRAAQTRHDFLRYRQDVAGFGEPRADGWDAYQRINTATRSGGIVGVFRNDSPEEQRRVTLVGLNPGAVYSVRAMIEPGGTLPQNADPPLLRATGAALMTEGFVARLMTRWAGRVYEVGRVE